jgi:hypothetical protein
MERKSLETEAKSDNIGKIWNPLQKLAKKEIFGNGRMVHHIYKSILNLSRTSKISTAFSQIPKPPKILYSTLFRVFTIF